MKQEEPKWLSRWDVQELPTLDELVPLTKALIPPDLALAFDIPAHINSNSDYVAPAAEAVSGGGGGSDSFHQRQTPPLQPSQSQSQSHSQSLSQQQQQVDYDSSDVAGGVGGDEHERTLKKPRLVWTPQLHKRFVDAVGHLGIKNAVPKTIMQLMGVEGLKRENVASHLQKYRLYLKRMQGGHPSGGLNGSISAADSAMDHLFASAPVPNHFLNRVPQQPQPASIPGSVPFTAPPGAGAMHPQHHHHQQMLAAATHHYQHQRHVGQLGSDLGFQHHRMLGGNAGSGGIRMVAPPPSVDGAGIRMMHHHPPLVGTYAEDLDTGCNSGGGGGGGGGSGRRVLSLFPTNE